MLTAWIHSGEYHSLLEVLIEAELSGALHKKECVEDVAFSNTAAPSDGCQECSGQHLLSHTWTLYPMSVGDQPLTRPFRPCVSAHGRMLGAGESGCYAEGSVRAHPSRTLRACSWMVMRKPAGMEPYLAGLVCHTNQTRVKEPPQELRHAHGAR